MGDRAVNCSPSTRPSRLPLRRENGVGLHACTRNLVGSRRVTGSGWARGQATAPGEEETTRAPAYLRAVSELVHAGVNAGFRVLRRGELRDERDRAEASLSRILTLPYRRSGRAPGRSGRGRHR